MDDKDLNAAEIAGRETMKARIIDVLKTEANRLAKSGAVRNARVIRNVLVEVYGLPLV